MHEMGLSESHTCVKIERIIDFTRGFRNGQRGCVRKLVVVADNEGFEGVFRVQMGFVQWEPPDRE